MNFNNQHENLLLKLKKKQQKDDYHLKKMEADRLNAQEKKQLARIKGI